MPQFQISNPSSSAELEHACDDLVRASVALDESYRVLEARTAELSSELAESRRARLNELAAKERMVERMASLLSILPGGVLLIGSDERILDANPEAFRLLGSPLIAEQWTVIEQRIESLSAATSIGGGKRLHLSALTRKLKNARERVALITDTTELRELQEQLGRQQRLASLGEMAAGLAHQIRTPLASMTLYLSQIGRGDLAEEQRDKILHRMTGRLAHMGGLIDSMLGFVRGQPPASETLQLRDVLDEFAAAVQSRIASSNSCLTIMPIDNSLVLKGNRDNLVGALSNLANNAIEAMPEGAEIEVSTLALDHQQFQLRIADNGPGISEENLERIFDPFFTTRAKGTGIGLSVVASTVAAHGGRIRVQNRVSGGTEFLIELPLFQPVATEESEML